MLNTLRPLPQVAVLVLWFKDTHIVVVNRYGKRYWELPGTRMAMGEDLYQAAERVGYFEVGLTLERRRISNPITSWISPQSLELVSVRVNLTDREYQKFPCDNISGTHAIRAITKGEFLNLFTRVGDRKLVFGP